MAKIIQIEDDLDLAEMTSAFFRQKGHTTVIYEDSEKAFLDISKQKTTGDVILTDLNMLKISGFELIRKLGALNIHIPIIVTTSPRSMKTAIEAIELGAFDFAVKPLHFPQLHICIERALHYAKLKDENKTLKTALQLKEGSEINEVLGKSPKFLKIVDLAKRVAKSKANVLITGESGTGKEVIAKLIHNLSPRSKKPFVAINCSAIPDHLLESELFGHAKGAFTGAVDKKIGLFEEADGGTLFLDEIGDLNPQLQGKLLRVLQDRKVRRVGENQLRNIDVRIISATHIDLAKAIQEESFREDLFFRLRVVPIALPPLRSRKEDIYLLADFFLKKYSALNALTVTRFSKEALEWLLQNSWKGNVRELENTIERGVVLSTGDKIELDDLLDNDFGLNGEKTDSTEEVSPIFDLNRDLTIDQLVKNYIRHVLKKNNGAKDKTAKDLAIDRKTLYRKLQEIETEGGFSH